MTAMSGPEAVELEVRPSRAWERAARTAEAIAGVVKAGLQHLLIPYAQIYFGRSLVIGLLFAAATFVVPQHGMAGVIGLVLANILAVALGRSEEQIAAGFYGYNGLLVGLALGLYFRFSVGFMSLLVVSVLVTVMIAALLRRVIEPIIGLPVLSMPFVCVTWLALLATRRLAGVELTVEPVLVRDLGAGFLPGVVELYLRSLAAAFFQLSVLSGGLILVGLLLFSRWATILSILGFASGYLIYTSLGGVPADLLSDFVGFNFILTAIAVGGIWILLRPSSLVFAAAGGAASAMISAALVALLQPIGLPPLAMPFIVVTHLFLFVVLTRSHAGRLQMVRGELASPERNLSRAVYRERRYPDPSVPVVFLPVMGQWIVTQGPDGDLTHRGLWSHAWDFEVADDDGCTFKNEGMAVTDYYAFRAPVVAPAEGKVLRVVNHLEDNPIGEVDTANNWGNLAILWHGGHVYSALCHLQKGSVTVAEGETVTAGQIIGRVGNSGRSPVPHLHFQLQASSEIGAPTLAGELIHYLCHEGSEKRYVTHGSPGTGARVVRMEVDDWLRGAFSLAPGRQWTWEVREREKRRREHWRSEIDAVGNRQLVEDSSGARLPFFADNHYTTLLDYGGAPDRLLGFFYLGVARLPYLKDEDARWSDGPSVVAFLSRPALLLHDLLLPFADLSMVTTRSRITRSAGSATVSTRVSVNSRFAARSLPTRIEIDLVTGVGPVAIRAYRCGEIVISAELLP